jgi:hypothetical protein
MLWMGLKKKAAYPGGAWSSGFRRLEGLVGVRFGRYRLLELAVEQQTAVREWRRLKRKVNSSR